MTHVPRPDAARGPVPRARARAATTLPRTLRRGRAPGHPPRAGRDRQDRARRGVRGGAWLSGARTSVVFCDVSDARDAAGIVDAMAIALARAERRDDVASGLRSAARGEVVLVIDNFDGLIEHALETVRRWIEAAPEAEIVVTSRDRLARGGRGRGRGGAARARRWRCSSPRHGEGRAASFACAPRTRRSRTRSSRCSGGRAARARDAGARLPLAGRARAARAVAGVDEGLRRDVRGGPGASCVARRGGARIVRRSDALTSAMRSHSSPCSAGVHDAVGRGVVEIGTRVGDAR